MELFPPAAAPPDDRLGLAWENPFSARAKAKKKARTGSRKATEVRDLESNVETKWAAAGEDRTFGDTRRWISPLEDSFRHSGWQNRRAKIFRGMVAAGYAQGRLERFANCGAWSTIVQDVDTGEMWVRGSCCHDRFCRPCTSSKALLIADNLEERLNKDAHDYLHIVLTTKHRNTPLAAQVDRIYKNFRRLRQRPLFRNHVDGGAAFLQVHVADSDGLWHVHFHLIARSEWLDTYKLSDEWKNITGDSTNVHVSKIHTTKKAVREVSRYAASPVDKDTTNDPDKLAELMRALHGRRLCFPFGSWRGHALTKPKPKDPDQRLETVGRLADIVARAAAGEEHAKHVIRILLERSQPKHAPPDLFDRAAELKQLLDARPPS